jgi:L-lactate dehydrogenase complex protein LldE
MAAKKQVGLFVTCLVDAMRPSVGFATLELLESAGCEVHVPTAQTCCGQPAYNSGDNSDTRRLAKQLISQFLAFEYVVAPSGSCAGMLRTHYPELFADDSEWGPKAHQLAARTYELTSFLVDVCNMDAIDAKYDGTITYHDSCAGLRELNVQKQPRQLLHQVSDCDFKPLKDADVCCGFGGTFCVKYSDVSNEMVSKKVDCIQKTGADTLVAGDLGCLMNMAGKLSREGSKVKCYHVAEILTGAANVTPPIGKTDDASH